jgi:cytochrome c553
VKNAILITLGMMLALNATAAGDPKAGKEKSAPCASCHGPTGHSAAPNFPILAGQYEDYLVQALQDYKSGARENPVMQGMAAPLSEQDMEDLAAYFSAQPGLITPDAGEH